MLPIVTFSHEIAAAVAAKGLCERRRSVSLEPVFYYWCGHVGTVELELAGAVCLFACEVSEVINSRLGLVITPSRLSSEVVVSPVCS
jgi:hypothetical protein